METEVLAIIMFAGTCLVLLAGFPVAFSLAGAALLFGVLGAALGHFDFAFVRALPQRVFGTMTNDVLIAVPLFVFMGVMLERSKVAEELLENIGRLFGAMRGGLAVSVALVGMLLAASTGIVGATVVTMGLMSLPIMLRRGYDPALACGSICAAGTLGQIIPPSIVLVLLGDQISSAYADAQRDLGNWAINPVSVGDLFAGALIPGLMLVGLYIVYQLAVAWLKPSAAPALPPRTAAEKADAKGLLRALVPPVALMVAVLGSILGGVATPTEAAAVGAVGAVLLAALQAESGRRSALVKAGVWGLIATLALSRMFDLRVARDTIDPLDKLGLALTAAALAVLAVGLMVALAGLWRRKVLDEVMRSTTRISSMVFLIVIGAALFALVFRGFGGDDMVHDFLTNLPGGKWGAIAVVMLAMFVLGFFLDFVEIVFVVVPIVAPILLKMDIDPVWLGILMAMNLQTSFLTPPFGFALFYLRGVAPPEVTTLHIYRGVAPFVLIQLAALGILAAWPELATWLPKVIFGGPLG
ncbi:TRAP transporter large permease [Novispirillum sp. DQ9]|uniref:TRAP transporter large permease n=1 Tax=Novispirillum sp. DQ9 TaxID=3398612 RepID=UPI003C7E04AA